MGPHPITPPPVKILTLLLALLFVIGSAGCGGGGGTKIVTVPTGSVSGYVYMDVSGRAAAQTRSASAPVGHIPFAGATATIGGVSATTDANGYFLISGAPVGTQTVAISKPGFGTIFKSVSVAAGQTTVAAQENALDFVPQVVSVQYTPANATISDNNISRYSIPRSSAGLLTVPGVSQPSEQEYSALRAEESSTKIECDVGSESTYFNNTLSVLVDAYNSKRTSGGTSTTSILHFPAVYRTSNSMDENFFNIYTCRSGREINAFAIHRTVVMNVGLMYYFDEASDFLSVAPDALDTLDQVVAILKKIRRNAVNGSPYQIVTPELANIIREDDQYGEVAAEVYFASLGGVLYHEIGHLALSHAVQSYRTPMRRSCNDQLTKWFVGPAMEHQADIFAANQLVDVFGDASGAIFMQILLDPESLLVDTASLCQDLYIESHPDARKRVDVVYDISENNRKLNYLYPVVPGYILNNEIVAGISATMKNRRKSCIGSCDRSASLKMTREDIWRQIQENLKK